ncbi:hypothetical protein GCM10022267_13070 [Lentzea roselyniae]|uniref:Tetratricopeptide repeat-containing protein n=1 Tax=Lentzea roselyniae TaxID=531940 RepID=A0ABP7AAL4_9PSEU
MEAARRDLARMRESADAWQELRYERTADGRDANEVPRAKVLWALQYDRRPGDLSLLRFLAEQEALCRRHSPHQGLGEQAALAGFLLAEHRQAEDAWRQYEIKRANFDTLLGYDVEHVFAAGVRVTIDHLRALDHPDRDKALEYLLGTGVDEERVEEWARDEREWFPEDPADEDPLTWFDRAMLVGEKDLARAELDRWASGRERDGRTLRTLCFHLMALDEFAEAARVQRESLAFADNDWDRASAWQTLAGLERRAGDHGAAWEALCECRRALEHVDGWREAGLGRQFVEELFLLAGQAEGELAKEAFAEAERQAREVPRLPPVVFEAAAEAALNIGDEAALERYP